MLPISTNYNFVVWYTDKIFPRKNHFEIFGLFLPYRLGSCIYMEVIQQINKGLTLDLNIRNARMLHLHVFNKNTFMKKDVIQINLCAK